MPELLERRRQDLEEQLGVLQHELDHWKALSAEHQPFEKHHSQIDALSRQMLDLNAKVRKEWNKSNDFAAIQKAQRDCGAVHTIWNYFREKLLMRADAQLGTYLRAADAYVWACYEPVLRQWRAALSREKKEGPLREPPLVTFDTESSPWALSRQGRYVPQGDRTGTTRSSLFADTLASMPIAILGIPWYTMELLPNLAVLAHETGHVVELDFGLADRVEQKLDDVMKASTLRDGWSTHWRKEVFADLFACLAAGPSWVWVLADNIPDSPDATRVKKRPTDYDKWGRYPPPTLRMLLNIAALRHLGYDGDAARLEKYWKADYTEHAMTPFEDDVKQVVPTFYDAAALPADLNYRQLVGAAAQAQRTTEKGAALAADQRIDPRALVGAACDVHRTAAPGFDKAAVWQRLQTHIVTSRAPGVLGPRKDREAATASAQMRTNEIAGLLFVPMNDDDD
jgi:hypothetical protein